MDHARNWKKARESREKDDSPCMELEIKARESRKKGDSTCLNNNH